MSRQRIPIGTHGQFTVMDLPDGRVEVRARYRDFDGKSRLVSVRATSRSAAEAELRKRLAQRHLYQPVDTTLSLDSLFGELVDYWLVDLDLEGRIAASTRFNYERTMRGLVLPAFEHLTLREKGGSPGATHCSSNWGRSPSPGRSRPRRCCASRSGSRSGTRWCPATPSMASRGCISPSAPRPR